MKPQAGEWKPMPKLKGLLAVLIEWWTHRVRRATPGGALPTISSAARRQMLRRMQQRLRRTPPEEPPSEVPAER